MVSFSCENCGDVLTKKKLDAHRNQCRGASFTCLDCMVHFRGTDYRSHTSCITEDQKYQGALYREKPAKNQNRKSISNIAHNNNHNDNKALVPRKAYVEDAPDTDDAPPHAPSPPPNPPVDRSDSVNVFDYLVSEQSPNMSQISLGGSKEPMAMKKGAPSVFSDAPKQLKDQEYSDEEHAAYNSEYEEQGYTYGTDPIRQPIYPTANESLTSLQFKTPTAKALNRNIKDKDRPRHHRQDSGTSDRKRKRGHVDPLDLSATTSNGQETVRFQLEGNTPMSGGTNTSTPASLNHSGLTGGLNRLLSDSAFPPSPDYSDEKERANGRSDPTSPLKRSRHTKEAADSNGLGIAIKGRAGRIMSLMGVAAAPMTMASNERALVKTRRRASSSESGQAVGGEADSRDHDRDRRPRKHHRVHRSSTNPHGTSSHSNHHRSSRHHGSSRNQQPSTSSTRKLKAIEYHYPNSDDSDNSSSDDDHPRKNKDDRSQLVKYDSETAALQRHRAEHFLSFVTKGPESEKGFSLNKCLKRWHRDTPQAIRGGGGSHRSIRELKADEEKELWRSLRLRRNDRGEVVVFF